MLAGRSCETVYTGHASAVNNWCEVHPRKKDNNSGLCADNLDVHMGATNHTGVEACSQKRDQTLSLCTSRVNR